MMNGCVRQKHNVATAEKRVRTTLFMVSLQNRAEIKTSATRAVNLVPYRANYFGHKLHINQNKKLVVLLRLLFAFFVKLFNL